MPSLYAKRGLNISTLDNLKSMVTKVIAKAIIVEIAVCQSILWLPITHNRITWEVENIA